MEAVQESPYFDYTRASRYCSVDKTTLWRRSGLGLLGRAAPEERLGFIAMTSMPGCTAAAGS
jgi:hypothetical protein